MDEQMFIQMEEQLLLNINYESNILLGVWHYREH